jgi:hypothetical protein
MRWRDIRFEKPTEADGDSLDNVLQLLCDGDVVSFEWDGLQNCIAWMPLSELPAFDRVPDPHKTWRFVEKGEAFDKRSQYWSHLNNVWLIAWQDDSYDPTVIYIVPIDPPKPEKRYRPFASAAEFAPHRDKWICTPGANTCRRVDHYNDLGVNGMAWESLLRNRTFEDGTPCGVEVSE